MTNFGLLGTIASEKTAVLRLFVDYIQTNKISQIFGGKSCSIIKTDFSGDGYIDPNASLPQQTSTIHPDRIVFREDVLNRTHTLFAPGNDLSRAVTRMNIITISRISKAIIALISFSNNIEEELAFFQDLRFFPKQIYVCFCNMHLVSPEIIIKELEKKKMAVVEYFSKRKVGIREFFYVSTKMRQQFSLYNDNAVRMILKVAIDTDGERPQIISNSISSSHFSG